MSAHAYVTYLIRNDAYVPGALVLAHSLREQETYADLVCLVTPEVGDKGIGALGLLFDRVIAVSAIQVDASADQGRQHVRHVLTRVNALRLGGDGDLGCSYEKIVLLDADVLPIRCYDHLFALETPAGIINERAEHFKSTRDGGYVVDGAVEHGRWLWHHHYRCYPHGQPIPSTVTDRVLNDASNYGVNTAVLVLSPSFREYCEIVDLLRSGDGLAAHLGDFRWPDMQFLSAYWSGRWRNIDVCYAGLCGYPNVALLFGTHFAGPKPWNISNPTVSRRFYRFADFRIWYREYTELLAAHPGLRSWRRLARLEEFAASSV